MAWERFQYLCRAALALNSSQPLSEYINQLNAKPSTDLYGQLPVYSLPRALLTKVAALSDTEQATKALHVYANLDPAYLIEKPHNTRRLPIYLLWVSATYLLLVLSYQFSVFPQFQEMLDSGSLFIPEQTLFFMNYGPLVGSIISLVLLCLVFITFSLNMLVSFKKDYSQHILLKYLCPRKLKTRYLHLVQLLYYPVTKKLDETDTVTPTIQTHLDDIAHSGMALEVEIGRLFKAEIQQLIRRCEIMAKVISVIIAGAIFYSVYHFIYGFYLPLFFYGASI